MMTQRGRLGLLQMGVRRNNRFGVGFGQPGDGAGEFMKLLYAPTPGPGQIETKIECNLIVSRTTGVQLAGRLSNQLAQPALDRGVNILVRGLERKLAGFHLGENRPKPRDQSLRLFGLNDFGGAKHLDVCDRAFDIHLEETAVRLVCGELPHCL
jgi:hypothetical protein